MHNYSFNIIWISGQIGDDSFTSLSYYKDPLHINTK